MTTITKAILKQIIPDTTPKFIRCPSCLQVKTADFVNISTGKEYCSCCAHRFKAAGKALLFLVEDKSVTIPNSEGEMKKISPQHRDFLNALDDPKVRYHVGFITLAANKVGQSREWGINAVAYLRDEGFIIPGRRDRRHLLAKYILAKLKETDYKSAIAQIVEETECNEKAVRHIARGLLANEVQIINPVKTSLTKEIKKLLSTYQRMNISEIQSVLGFGTPRSSIKSACDRLRDKGIVHMEKQDNLNYFRLN